jgi:hypothetical protein
MQLLDVEVAKYKRSAAKSHQFIGVGSTQSTNPARVHFSAINSPCSPHSPSLLSAALSGFFVMPSYQSPFRGLSIRERFGLLVIGALALGFLFVAAALPPSERGWGTHQQLGLPACSIQQFCGWRCPACGMTTAWSHFVRGQWLAALSCNAGGVALAATCVAAIPWTIGSAVRGDWIWLRPTDPGRIMIGSSILAVILTDWLLRLIVDYSLG